MVIGMNHEKIDCTQEGSLLLSNHHSFHTPLEFYQKLLPVKKHEKGLIEIHCISRKIKHLMLRNAHTTIPIPLKKLLTNFTQPKVVVLIKC